MFFVKTVDKSFKLLIYWFKMEMSLFVALDDGTSQMISTTQRISQISRTLSINKQGTSFIFFVKNIPEVKNTMLSKPYLFLNVISRALRSMRYLNILLEKIISKMDISVLFFLCVLSINSFLGLFDCLYGR